jgi:hypothetical protein
MRSPVAVMTVELNIGVRSLDIVALEDGLGQIRRYASKLPEWDKVTGLRTLASGW